jgi:hypothetical protein
MDEIAKAIVEVTKAIKGIEKDATVGSGNYAYKGVKYKDVTDTVRPVMTDNGLSCLPIGVTPEHKIERWEASGKTKQSVFTTVSTKYLLLHESGQSIELAGYGQGSDTQDKGAGKATTYALKNTLLYTFLISTGKIEDTDTDHSNDIEVPQAAPIVRQVFDNTHSRWEANKNLLANKKITMEKLETKYIISDEAKKELNG